MTLEGARLFSRYAFPPNSMGYCGPEDPLLVRELLSDSDSATAGELAHAAQGFAGAWPYLELIASRNGSDPLDHRVVEAYWIGNALLEGIDMGIWGNSLWDRFARRAGGYSDMITAAALGGGVPCHAFHVFCVYPWVGLLRDGLAEPALHVIDNCRISWGLVEEILPEGTMVVHTARLTWDGRRLDLGLPQARLVRPSIDRLLQVKKRDTVTIHWDVVCDRVSPSQAAQLHVRQEQHLALVNRETRRLERVLAG